MADSLLNYLGKRRTRSSTSSGGETSISPELKRLKDAEPSPDRVDGVEETNDEVMEALGKIGTISEQLNSILARLAKLDVIESSVKNIESNLANLKARTAKLEQFEIKTETEIKDLKKLCKTNGDKHEVLQNQLDSLNEQTASLMEKERNLQEQVNEMMSRNLYLESYSRRENIKFFSIPEGQDEDTEEVLRDFMEQELGYHDARSVEIQRVHRLNRRRDASGPRPIIARFLRYKNVEEIFALGRRLEGTGYQMFRDFPQEIIERRKEQMPVFKKARRNGLKASFSRRQPDKLYINGELWPCGKPFQMEDHTDK